MPALGEDWMIEAEDYAREAYNKTLDDLSFDFNDGSVFFECPQYWVDGRYRTLLEESLKYLMDILLDAPVASDNMTSDEVVVFLNEWNKWYDGIMEIFIGNSDG